MLNYIFESIVTLGIFYLIYFFIIRNEMIFVFNRIYILFAITASLILPLVEINLAGNSPVIPAMSYYLDEIVVSVEDTVNSKISFWQRKWLLLYLGVMGILLYQLVWQFLQIQKIRNANQVLPKKGYTIIYTSGKLTHFSFFRYIFINRDILNDEQEIQRVLKHEEAHVKQWHSLDILLLELVKIMFWFNPFVWLFKAYMVNNHEYLADNHVVSLGEDKTEYLEQIVNNSLTNYSLSLINNFNYSLTKKRVVMMTKQKIKWLTGMKIFFIVPVLAGIAFIFSCTENPADDTIGMASENGNQDDVFYIVETMPQFRNDGTKGFQSYISENLVYPDEAKKKGIEGKVFVEFVVGANGVVKNAKIARSAHPILDKEALRIVEASPIWEPGIQRGKMVDVLFTFPIAFKLQ